MTPILTVSIPAFTESLNEAENAAGAAAMAASDRIIYAPAGAVLA